MRYIKKPIPVMVDFAIDPGEMITLEGKVSFKRGDAIMTGLSGERWPIPRERFQQTYSPQDPSLEMGKSGFYIKKPMLVLARQVSSALSIPLSDERGSLQAKSGDWVLESEDGETWVVDHAIFIRSYQKA